MVLTGKQEKKQSAGSRVRLPGSTLLMYLLAVWSLCIISKMEITIQPTPEGSCENS